MSKKQPRLIQPNCHRPIPWNEKAVLRAIAEDGYVIVQAKEDGFRFHAFLDPQNEVVIVTREGIEIQSLGLAKRALASDLRAAPPGTVFDGEVVVLGMPFEEASGHLRRFELIQHPVDFYLFDMFPIAALLGEEHKDTGSYEDRLEALSDTCCPASTPIDQVHLIESWEARSLTEVQSTYESFRASGKEGAVVKRAKLGVRNGKVTGQWKLKPSDSEDGIIRGLVWGTPGLGNEGKVIGFTVELESGVLCDVTGITQKQMLEFTEAGAALLGRYVEVSYMELTRDGSLRHPRFERFRDLDYSPGWKA